MTQPIQLSVNISLNQQYGGTIRVEENLELPAMSFLELAKVLGQFHDLAAKIKAEQEKVKP